MHWYCLTCTPQNEFRAEAALRQRGFEVRVPYQEREFRRRLGKDRRGGWRKEPLLRRYLLVQAPHGAAIGQLVYEMSFSPRRTITGYLGSYGNPTPVPAQHLEAVEALSGRKVGAAPQIVSLKVGDTHRIVHGPMAGISAKITKVKGENVKMLLQWLGSTREVEVQVRYLQATA